VRYFDAHNHLHDTRLKTHRESCIAAMSELPVAGAVVNGTREDDWNAVATLAAQHPTWITASFGIHPWHAATRSETWLDVLRRYLDENPPAGVGEIGLDRWIDGHDIEDQTRVFVPQLRLAAELNRAATIHCLRAWGALWDIVRTETLPARGFLLHAYGGPEEMIGGFARRGAYFSFNPYFLHSRKISQREAFLRVPLDRLLVETDAPDMRPPDEHNPRPLRSALRAAINHPANIDVAYRALAQLKGLDLEALGAQVEENFRRLFKSGHQDLGTCRA
jgi:TatD DNase family protein